MVQTPNAGCLGKCKFYGLQVTYEQRNQGHEDSQICHDMEARKLQHRATAASMEALQQELTTYGEELGRVEIFKYLGRLIAYDDNNAQAMRSNLMKAQKCWAHISRVLRAENASPRVCGLF